MDNAFATPYPPSPTRYFRKGVYLLPPSAGESGRLPSPCRPLPWFTRAQLAGFHAYLRRPTPDFWNAEESGLMQDAYVIIDG